MHLVGRGVERSAAAPMWRSSLSVVVTSCSRGTLASVTGSATSSAAHSSGSAAFLAPEIATSPWSGRPPRMRSLSMMCARGDARPRSRRTLRSVDAHAATRSARRGWVQWWWCCGRPVLAVRPLGGGERLHRQRVDLLAHSIAQRRIDPLVARARGCGPRTRPTRWWRRSAARRLPPRGARRRGPAAMKSLHVVGGGVGHGAGL